VYASLMRTALSLLVTMVTLASLAGSAEAQATTYEARIRQAAVQVASGNREAGLAALRTAVAESPSRPEAICYLAEAYRAGGDFVAALENFQACLRVARSANDVGFTARAMHGVASTFERMPEHLTDARAAWLEYARFADGATSVASAQIGRERVTAIDVASEQERVYVEVRQRIAERERVAAAPPAPAGH
jgi:hypothetical protein